MALPCPDCGKEIWSRGYCSTHYKKRRKAGLLERVRQPIGSLSFGSGHRYHRQFLDGKQQFIHRYVMEKILGRPLLPSEVVHHINEDRYNNDPSNLQLTNQSAHSRLHMTKYIRTETHKECSKCKVLKPRRLFYPNRCHAKKGWDPNLSKCITCSRNHKTEAEMIMSHWREPA